MKQIESLKRFGDGLVNLLNNYQNESFDYTSFVNKMNKISTELSSLECTLSKEQIAEFNKILQNLQNKLAGLMDNLNLSNPGTTIPSIQVPGAFIYTPKK